jgi:hypothetical protein
MFEFMKGNWFQVFLALGVLAGYVHSYIEAVKVKVLENNHIHSLERAVEELKKDVAFIREETVKQWREIENIRGRMNGKPQ